MHYTQSMTPLRQCDGRCLQIACCVSLQDDDKPMIEIMDQLSPAVMNSFVHVAVSDSVSGYLLHISIKYRYSPTAHAFSVLDH